MKTVAEAVAIIKDKERRIAREEEFDSHRGWDRKAVCKRCHCVMNDGEPTDFGGFFIHPSVDKTGKAYKCKNAGLIFNTQDKDLEPFLPKRERRLRKRNGIRL